MKLRTLLLAGAALALAACGGGGGSEQTVDFSTWVEAEVFYTYPYEGQQDVAPRAPAPMVLSATAPCLTMTATARTPRPTAPWQAGPLRHQHWRSARTPTAAAAPQARL